MRPRPSPICEAALATSSQPDVEAWLEILLPSSGADGEWLDCAGRPALDPDLGELGERCEVAMRSPLEHYTPTNADLSVTPTDDGAPLVWIQTTRFSDGFASGPLALVETDGGRARVLALGTVVAPATNPRLSLEGDWLVIYAERCWPNRNCQPILQLLGRDGGRLVNLALELDDESCVAPAQLSLLTWARTRAGEGSREYRIERELHFSADGMPVIHEHLSILDLDPPGAQRPRLVREQTLERAITRDGATLRAAPGLWAEIESEGLVELEPDAAPLSAGTQM